MIEEQDDEFPVLLNMDQAGLLIAMAAFGDDQTQKGRDLVLFWIALAVDKGLDLNTANRYKHAIGKKHKINKIRRIARDLGGFVSFQEMMIAAGAKFKKKRLSSFPRFTMSPIEVRNGGAA